MKFPTYKTRQMIKSEASNLVLHEEPAIAIEDAERNPREFEARLAYLEELIGKAREEMEE